MSGAFVDNRTVRERILAMAAAAKDLDEPERRIAVKGLMKQAVAPAPPHFRPPQVARCFEAEIFERAYGDHQGRRYWESWLFHLLPARQLADLIGTHAPRVPVEHAAIRGRIAAALDGMEFKSTGEAVDWLIRNPDTTDFVSESLRQFREPIGGKKEAAEPPKKPGRPPGTGYEKQDRPLVDEMKELLRSGKVGSIAKAAEAVAARAVGASTEAKVDRLTGRYQAWIRE